MGEAFITRRSGGQASPEIFSVLDIIYPSGSTCTINNGAITLTAPDTSGKALFNVEPGTWVITVTNGIDSAIETVEVTAEGQHVNAKLNYKYYLLKDSVYANGHTGQRYYYVVFGSQLLYGTQDVTQENFATFGGSGAVDLQFKEELSSLVNNHETLNIRLNRTRNAQTFIFGLAKTLEGSINEKNDIQASTTMTETGDTILTIDISQLSGLTASYLHLYVYDQAGTIYDIWFE